VRLRPCAVVNYATMRKSATVASAPITTCIRMLRGQRVILDADLAALYGVPTKRLNEQVRRNPARFPSDFTFQLTNQEVTRLRSQNATSNGLPGRGGRRYLPCAYTEHGALMAANVLNSARAIEVSVYVVRAFVELRGTLATSTLLAERLDELEARLERRFAEHDETIVGILAAIRQLMTPREPKRRPIGFVTGDERKRSR
jgi:phage regulator Rha-like protein